MSEFDLDKVLPPRVRVMRIILLALFIGCLVFLGVVLVGKPANVKARLLTYVGIGFGLLMLVLQFIFPRMAVATARRQIARGTWNPSSDPRHPLPEEQVRGMNDIEKLLAVYQSQLIVGAALLEGGTFCNLIMYMQEGDPASLVMAAVLMAALVWRFPTRDRVEQFLVEQGELLRQERQSV